MWDWMDKHEDRKDSSHAAMEKEKVRQGSKKAKSKAIKKSADPRLIDWSKEPNGRLRGHRGR